MALDYSDDTGWKHRLKRMGCKHSVTDRMVSEEDGKIFHDTYCRNCHKVTLRIEELMMVACECTEDKLCKYCDKETHSEREKDQPLYDEDDFLKGVQACTTKEEECEACQ